ncbi:ribonuclease H-like domain-containing protein [Desulfovibrio sp. OttesenSCG-928-C06]|nr:ribonuclease H-like domain-containing protein [Desulfovibrio sp. OttesenSCG-928-C06]
MLTHTFLHLSGVGKAHDAKLREHGLLCWNDVLGATQLPFKNATLRNALLAGAEESCRRLEDGDALWFSERLPISEQWRLYPHFHGGAAYVDIETTGLSWPSGGITSIALYDGKEVKVYVQGRNLDDFMEDIARYSLLVTWNGRAFDAPFIRKAFGIPLQMAHLDLFPVFRSLGIKGGLKKVEKFLGLEREGLDGVDGYMAILLWREFMRTGEESVLETLLAYNVEDVLSLEILARHACQQHQCSLEDYGVADCSTGADAKFDNPYRADRELLERLMEFMPGRWG